MFDLILSHKFVDRIKGIQINVHVMVDSMKYNIVRQKAGHVLSVEQSSMSSMKQHRENKFVWVRFNGAQIFDWKDDHVELSRLEEEIHSIHNLKSN
jgi:hypothetical protein